LTSISSFPPRELRFQVQGFGFRVTNPPNLWPRTLNLPWKIAGWVVFNPSGFRRFQAVQASQTDLHVNDPSNAAGRLRPRPTFSAGFSPPCPSRFACQRTAGPPLRATRPESCSLSSLICRRLVPQRHRRPYTVLLPFPFYCFRPASISA